MSPWLGDLCVGGSPRLIGRRATDRPAERGPRHLALTAPTLAPPVFAPEGTRFDRRRCPRRRRARHRRSCDGGMGLGAGDALGAVVLGVALWAFRDPLRTPPPDAGRLLLAPADGTVVEIVDEAEPVYLKGPSRRVSISPSPLRRARRPFARDGRGRGGDPDERAPRDGPAARVGCAGGVPPGRPSRRVRGAGGPADGGRRARGVPLGRVARGRGGASPRRARRRGRAADGGGRDGDRPAVRVECLARTTCRQGSPSLAAEVA